MLVSYIRLLAMCTIYRTRIKKVQYDHVITSNHFTRTDDVEVGLGIIYACFDSTERYAVIQYVAVYIRCTVRLNLSLPD